MTPREKAEAVAKWSNAYLDVEIQPWQVALLERVYGDEASGMATMYAIGRSSQANEILRRALAQKDVLQRAQIARIEHEANLHGWRFWIGLTIPSVAFLTVLVLVITRVI